MTRDRGIRLEPEAQLRSLLAAAVVADCMGTASAIRRELERRRSGATPAVAA